MATEPKPGIYTREFHWNGKTFYESRVLNKVVTRWGKRMAEWYVAGKPHERWRYTNLDEWADWAREATHKRF